jgi:uncharacterized protein (TIGR02117 family)
MISSVRRRSNIRATPIWLLFLLAESIGGCAAAPPSPVAGSAARNEVVYVIAGGWHTELAVPTRSIGGKLASLTRGFADVPYVIFGWGARDYYMARNPGIADALRAATPGPAVMLVIPLAVSPVAYVGADNAYPVRLSRDGVEALQQFLWASLAKDHNGAPYEAGPGPYPQSVFYAATGTYDLSDTCNTWTAEALRAAGVPVTAAGVVFAGQLLGQLRSPR